MTTPQQESPPVVAERLIEPVRVLYLGGAPRSGSTLVNRMIGQLPGHCAVGELVDLWQRGVVHNQHCSCGEPFAQCVFWSEVGRRAFGGWDRIDPQAVIRLKRSVDRTACIPLLLAPAVVPSFRRRLRDYTDLLTRLYAAVRDVSGATVVVDSSKNPSTPYALRHAQRVDLRVAHIVRDPRGVAYSWSRQVHRPEKAEGARYSRIWSARLVGRRWLTINALVAALGRLGVPVLLVRYEDVVADPRRELRRVAALVGAELAPDSLDFVGDGVVELAPTHIAAGNRNRFVTGQVGIRADEQWRSGLAASRQRTVEVITWPLRRRYGYSAHRR